MYTSYQGIQPSVMERLCEAEQTLGLPIRVVTAAQAVRSWARCGLGSTPNEMREIAEEQGITIINHSMPDVRRNSYRDTGFKNYTDPVTGATYDIAQPHESATEPVPDNPLMADGFTFGEYDMNQRQLYLYLYLSITELTQFPVITEAFFEVLLSFSNPEAREAAAARRSERARELLVEFAKRTANQQITLRRNNIDLHTSTIASSRVIIANAYSQLTHEQQLLDALLLVAQEETGERILSQFDELREHPRVTAVDFSHNTMTLKIVTTPDIEMTREDTGETRWLGAFRIEMNLSDFEIELHNLNTRRGGRDHPHVNNGVPCFGGHEDSMYELLGKGELALVFDLLLQYLETFNMADSWGSYGAYWFDVPDERPLETTNPQEIAA